VARKVCDVVRVNARRTQARGERPAEVVKVKVVHPRVLDGPLEAVEQAIDRMRDRT